MRRAVVAAAEQRCRAVPGGCGSGMHVVAIFVSPCLGLVSTVI